MGHLGAGTAAFVGGEPEQRREIRVLAQKKHRGLGPTEEEGVGHQKRAEEPSSQSSGFHEAGGEKFTDLRNRKSRPQEPGQGVK